MYISSVCSDNLTNESVRRWIIGPLLIQKWGVALYFSLSDLPTYVVKHQGNVFGIRNEQPKKSALNVNKDGFEFLKISQWCLCKNHLNWRLVFEYFDFLLQI